MSKQQDELYKAIEQTLRDAESLSLTMLKRSSERYINIENNIRLENNTVRGIEKLSETLGKEIDAALTALKKVIEQRKNKEASPAELYEAFECMGYQCSTGIIKDCREKIIAAETPEQIDKIILDAMELTMLVKNSPKSSSQDKAYCDAECEALRKMGEQRKKVLANSKQSANSHKNKSFKELLLCDESKKDIITFKITEIFTDAKPKHIAHALYALNEIGYIRFGKGDKESVYRVCLNTFGYKGQHNDTAYSALSKAVGYYTNSSDSKIDSELIELDFQTLRLNFQRLKSHSGAVEYQNSIG